MVRKSLARELPVKLALPGAWVLVLAYDHDVDLQVSPCLWYILAHEIARFG